MRFIERILCFPGQFHVCRGDGFLARVQRRPCGDELEGLFSGYLFDSGNAFGVCQQQVLVQIRMPKVDAIKLDI